MSGETRFALNPDRPTESANIIRLRVGVSFGTANHQFDPGTFTRLALNR